MNLSTANILITGGASGLGKAMAIGLVDKAANVIVVDRNDELLQMLQAEAPRIKCYKADLTNYDEVEGFVEQLFGEYGKINVLVNNAGIIHSEPLVNIL